MNVISVFIKKSLHLLLPVIVIFSCLAGCAPKEPAKPALAKIADHLYETTYTADFNREKANVSALPGFSCSAVQNGKYRGRNYDWTYADTDICVIHTTVTANRPHASVGICDLSFAGTENGT